MINSAPRFAVVLSGCGVFDGSEIHEAVLTMLAIDEAGGEYRCFAPNTWQAKTVDHFTGQATALAGDDDNRNVLAESARIARGDVKDLAEFDPKEFDVIVFPGGFGAAMNWSNFAVKGPDCEINKEVEKAIRAAYENGLVIGAMCIAPVVIARVLGKHKIAVTIGTDPAIGTGIEKMGAVHEPKGMLDVCVDEDNKIVTTPAYMLGKTIKDIRRGTQNLIDEIINLID
jgi:COG3155: uncharacterized protein involved in an early stage of isoprenoid biosynthesis